MANAGSSSMFAELRRRRLFKTVALYVVGAWAALQVTELALPALEIPDTAIRWVWIGVFALFPLVLLFGWRYDVTRGGIRHTPPAGSDEPIPLTRTDHWIIGCFSVAALAVPAPGTPSGLSPVSTPGAAFCRIRRNPANSD